VPDGVKPPPMSLAGWGRVLRNPWLMALVGVTVLSGAGQFTLFSYMAPYYRDVLGASAGGISFLFMWFGLFGLVGNVLLTRWIDRLGAPRCVNLGLVSVGLAFLAWPWAGTLAVAALLLVPWALGTFSSNSAQQARLSAAAPAVAPALLALNTSAIYAGQALGAAGGGAILAAGGYGPMAAVALAWVAAALVVSLLLARKADVGRVDA
jgi:predicted MFS family arabinose efflux permease